MRTPTHERGAALLTTLLITAALSAIAVGVLDNMRRSQRLWANAQSLAQAQWYAIGAEAYVRVQGADIRLTPAARAAFAKGPLALGFQLDHGAMSISVSDASLCINLNGVVSGAGEMFEPNPTGISQLAALMIALDIPARQAEELTQAITDWIDTDADDDSAYRGLAQPYRSGSELLSEESELRAVAGVTPEIYAKLRPHVCALPIAKPARVNLNALRPDNAPVLVALSEGRIPLAIAQRAIAQRPANGWISISEFWMQDALAGLQIPETAYEHTGLDASYLALTVHVTHLDAEAVMSQLLVLSPSGDYVPAGRRWSDAS